jgi:hypothetical protein
MAGGRHHPPKKLACPPATVFKLTKFLEINALLMGGLIQNINCALNGNHERPDSPTREMEA